MNDVNTPPIGLDLLMGVQAIADLLGLPRRQTQYLCDTGRLPIFKLGNRIAARMSELDRALSAQRSG